MKKSKHNSQPNRKGSKMKTYRVTVWNDTYTDYLVGAKNKDEAEEKVFLGEYDLEEDVYVKHSDIVNTQECKEESRRK